MPHCLLDVLPAELFYIIFNYFWAHEILTTFSNVSPYLDSILVSYSSYQVNFKSILRPHFDLICRILRPDQIVLLILSDSDDTPCQAELFLSHFQIGSLTRLQSLTLHEIERRSLMNILEQINRFNQNFQLSLDNCDIQVLLSIKVPSQLRYLKINKSDPQLAMYYRSRFSLNFQPDLRAFVRICENTPQLQLLNIHCDNTSIINGSLLELEQLTCLVLKIES
ncbi:unnamed protein product [Rotaria socialis]|uniref:F-box domain-containing protein n=1 Tax=Rotaria socialis TaxID=392032 RepID=A0A817VHD9_9BILA|nr:unnamed protein product [Rotaria socialis]CAF4650697.1 unnamed protein product [Rotaria socialis]